MPPFTPELVREALEVNEYRQRNLAHAVSKKAKKELAALEDEHRRMINWLKIHDPEWITPAA